MYKMRNLKTGVENYSSTVVWYLEGYFFNFPIIIGRHIV